jgi:hypothetical protein
VNFLPFYYETIVRAYRHRKHYIRQTVCIAATCTGKMRVTLFFGTVMSQLKMGCPFIYKSLVYQSRVPQTLERSVDCYLIESFSAAALGNLLLT